jgi:hypothetical protein
VPPCCLAYGRLCRYLVVDSRNVVDDVTFLNEIIIININMLLCIAECGRRNRSPKRGSRVRYHYGYCDSFASDVFGMIRVLGRLGFDKRERCHLGPRLE